MSSIPTEGTGNLSQTDAVNMLLDTSPTEVESEVQEAPVDASSEVIETEIEEVEAEAADDSQVEAESDEILETVEEGEEEPYYTVKVDGQEYEVNEAELIKSYQLERTAQKRLSEAAEQRKLIESDRTAIEQERAKYAQALQLIQSQLATQNTGQKTEAEWNELYTNDPMEYVRQRENLRDKQAQLQAVQQEQAALTQQNLINQQSKLLDFIPEWKNAETATREKTELVSYLKSHGFTDQDVANAADARIISLA